MQIRQNSIKYYKGEMFVLELNVCNFAEENNENVEEKLKLKTFVDIVKKRKINNKNRKKCQKITKIRGFEQKIKKSRNLNVNEKEVVLTEYETMRIWVKTLLSIYGSIPNIIKIIDQIISNQASNPFGISGCHSANTFDQFERVIDFCERKNKLINIYVLIQKMIEGLSSDDLKLVELKFVNKVTAEAIAGKFDINLRTVYRRIEAVVKKLATESLARGWTTLFISHQLSNEPWVSEQFEQIKAESVRRGVVLN